MSQNKKEVALVLERIYPATPEELWDLWATKEGFASWWGPQGFRVEVSVLEPRPGGALVYEMIADDPACVQAMKDAGQAVSHGVRATFSVFAPHRELALTSVIDFIPGVEAYESLIAVTFAPHERGARMVVQLHAMHDPHWTGMQIEGFTSQLGKLDARYAA